MKRTNQVTANKLTNLMSKIPFFINLTASERMQVAKHAQIFVAEANEAIIEKDATDNCFYVLLSGEGKVCLERDHRPVALIGPGDIFGEIGFVLSTPRTSWVVATKVCALIRVDNKLLNGIDPAARDKLKDQIILKLAQTIQAFNESK